MFGIDPVALVGCVSRGAMGGASPSGSTALDSARKTAPLSRLEMDDLVALGEALVEDRALAPAERLLLIERIEARTTQNREYVSVCRMAVSTLQRLAGRRFASLEIRERAELIGRHRLTASHVWPGEDLGPFPEEMRALRMRIVKDLIGGYYGSSAGWAVVGYQTFPGRCGDLTRYTRAES